MRSHTQQLQTVIIIKSTKYARIWLGFKANWLNYYYCYTCTVGCVQFNAYSALAQYMQKPLNDVKVL